MVILEVLKDKSENLALPFLVIGGHAVNAHCVARQTGDLDLCVRASDGEKWKEMLLSLGYKLHNAGKGFIQFRPPQLGSWPVDLMLVNPKTFDDLVRDAVVKAFGKISCRVPTARHLISMKLHALKTEFNHRFLKDGADIVKLAEADNLDLQSDDFRALCLKYSNENVYESFRKLTEKS